MGPLQSLALLLCQLSAIGAEATSWGESLACGAQLTFCKAKCVFNQQCQAACDQECKVGIPPMSEIIGNVKSWTDEQWEAVEEVDLDEFFDEAKKLGGDVWKSAPVWFLKNLTDVDWARVDLSKLSPDQFEGLSWERFATWSKEQWDGIPVDQIIEFSWEQLQQVPLEDIGKMTQEQIRRVPVDKLMKLLGEQVAKLDAETLAGLSREYWDSVPIAQITKFTAETFQKLCSDIQNKTSLEHKCPSWVGDLEADKIAHIAGDAWQSIPVDTVIGFSVDQLQAINYEALSNWTKKNWDALPVDTILKFSGDQIAAVPADVVAGWGDAVWKSIPVDVAISFTAEQLEAIPLEQLRTKIAYFTAAQIEQLSQKTLAALNADPKTAAIIEAIKGSKTETDELLTKVRAHGEKLRTKIRLQGELSEIEMTPGATTEEIEAAKAAATAAENDEKTAAAEVQVALRTAPVGENLTETNDAARRSVSLALFFAASVSLAVFSS